MARPVVFRAIKRTRLNAAGIEEYNDAGHVAPNFESNSADVTHAEFASSVKKPKADQPSKKRSARKNRSA